MKICKGVSASPGLVLGQVSRLERHVETFSTGPFDPERELRQLEDAVRTAQSELDSMAERAASTEQAILQFQSMMLDDEGMMNEVRFCIKAGISAAAAMDKVGQRYADQLANMKDNPYMQLRSVDILDATSRVINILGNRPRMWLALDHPVILAADRLMPTDLFSVPSGMILGVVTTEGSGQSHAAIIARAMNIPGIVQVGPEFLDDCDGRTVILDATKGECILDPDAVARQQAEARICELQRENEEMRVLGRQPGYTRDGAAFELLANCFGPEDIDTAMQSGARGVGLLRSSYMMLPGRILDEQEQFYFYSSCLAAAQGCPVTVRTFDFGADRTMADAYQGVQSSKLGLRGIRNSLRQPRQFETQICALQRKDPLRRHAQRAVGLPDRGGIRGPWVRFSGHRHQRPDPVHPRRRPGAGQRGALLPPRQPGHEKAHRHGHGDGKGRQRAGDHLRPGRGQPGEYGAVPANGPAQLLGEPAEPAEYQKGSAGSRRPPGRRRTRMKAKDARTARCAGILFTERSFQIAGQGHHGGEHGQRGGLAPQDAGAKANRFGSGFGGHFGLLGGKAALGSGHDGDLPLFAVGGCGLSQQLAHRRAAALVAEQHQVVLVKGAAHGPEVGQRQSHVRQHAPAALLGGFQRDAVVALVLLLLFFGGGHAIPAEEGHHMGGPQLHAVLDDLLQLVLLGITGQQGDLHAGLGGAGVARLYREFHAVIPEAGDGGGVFHGAAVA